MCKIFRVMGQMRYWIMVLMLSAVEAKGQDMTRIVGTFIAFHADCEYEKASETTYYYKCKDTITTSDFIQLMSAMIRDYESFNQVIAWTDAGRNVKYAVIQNKEGVREVYYDILYLADYKVFGVRLYDEDNFLIEP